MDREEEKIDTTVAIGGKQDIRLHPSNLQGQNAEAYLPRRGRVRKTYKLCVRQASCHCSKYRVGAHMD